MCRAARPSQAFPATPERSSCFSSDSGMSWCSSTQHGSVRPAASLDARPVGPVDLRGVPPMAVVGHVGRRRRARRVVLGVKPGAPDLHGIGNPAVLRRYGDRPGVVAEILAMTEPVVHLELQPGGDQGVGPGSDDQLVPREQPRAHQPGTGLQHGGQRRPEGLGVRNVPPEPRAPSTHPGIVPVVPAPVVAAGLLPSRVPRLGRGLGFRPGSRAGSRLAIASECRPAAGRRTTTGIGASRIAGR